MCPILDGNKLQLIFVYVWQQNRTCNIENKIKSRPVSKCFKSSGLQSNENFESYTKKKRGVISLVFPLTEIILKNMDWTFIRLSPFVVKKNNIFLDTISRMSANHVSAFSVISQGFKHRTHFFYWTQESGRENSFGCANTKRSDLNRVITPPFQTALWQILFANTLQLYIDSICIMVINDQVFPFHVLLKSFSFCWS